jgi:very-short-patch-repair endonuclease
MAAVLTGSTGTVLSHGSAAALWKICRERERAIHVTTPRGRDLRQPSLIAHRRSTLPAMDVTVHDGIPVTTPVRTLIDLATRLSRRELETAVNETDKLGLIDPETLRREISERKGLQGLRVLRGLLDRQTFSLTDSELERLFIPLAASAGLPKPVTQHHLHGFRADFYWPELGLVVETDGLRYHRTPLDQARDRLRDQTFTAAGLTVLRFTHAQVRYEPRYLEATLRRVARRLGAFAT